MAETNLREISLDILYEILEENGFSHLVLGGALEKHQYLSKQQRAFLTRLTQGTVERLVTLDGVINLFADKPKVAKMKPMIRTLLRQGVYQILYMDGVPDAAVCNEAVKLAKKKGFAGLSGFVNGVLRSIARKKDSISFSDWSMKYAMPQWIIDLWLLSYPPKVVEEMLEAFLAEQKTCIRVNTARITPEELTRLLEEEGVQVQPCADIPYGCYITGYDYLKGLNAFRQGLFYVQDVSSMKAVAAAGIREGDYVLDVCAAPGGKSLQAAELLHGTGFVEARDVSADKVALLQENIQRSKLTNIRGVLMDALVLDEASLEKADVLLCDAPCSGLGVIGRKPDIKYRMTPQKQAELVGLQRQILSAVCSYVKVGGTLLYSTCTINREENEDNVVWFLKEYPSFTLEAVQQLLPTADGQDGFFYAKMKRGA